MKICSIILSAGKSSRMRSDLPKPFHKIAGMKMIDWVINTNLSIKLDKLLIVSSNKSSFLDYAEKYEVVIQ